MNILLNPDCTPTDALRALGVGVLGLAPEDLVELAVGGSVQLTITAGHPRTLDVHIPGRPNRRLEARGRAWVEVTRR